MHVGKVSETSVKHKTSNRTRREDPRRAVVELRVPCMLMHAAPKAEIEQNKENRRPLTEISSLFLLSHVFSLI